ncbi:MAG: CHAT domain-containing protein [Symploca sp. SIO2E6]|nr:CHAT domain-containing protein [Symploca sp. SIO2E6]
MLTAPAIQLLALTHQQREQLGENDWSSFRAKDALVVGNPTMPWVAPALGESLQQLPSLPGAQREAVAIASLLNTQAIIGKQATKARIEELMPQARIILLATHGLLDTMRGLGSAIAFTPQDQHLSRRRLDRCI